MFTDEEGWDCVMDRQDGWVETRMKAEQREEGGTSQWKVSPQGVRGQRSSGLSGTAQEPFLPAEQVKRESRRSQCCGLSTVHGTIDG